MLGYEEQHPKNDCSVGDQALQLGFSGTLCRQVMAKPGPPTSGIWAFLFSNWEVLNVHRERGALSTPRSYAAHSL